jgi:hypothetical protein
MRPAILGMIVFSASCFAQTAAVPVTKIGDVTVTGSLRARSEIWDWFQPDSGDNAYAYSGNIFRIGFSQYISKLDWNVEFAAPVLLGLPANPFGPGAQGQLGLGANYSAANNRAQNAAMIFPKQAYIRWKKLGGKEAHSFRVGRFEFQDGSEVTPKNASLAALKRDRINQRLIGAFGWSDVGRSFDGAQHTYATPSTTFTVMGAVPTRGAFQVDGWGWNQTVFGYAAFTRTWKSGKRHTAETRFFFLPYDDWRGVLKTDNRPAAVRRADEENIRIETYGGHSIHALETSAGTIDGVFWGALQSGHWGTQAHRAYAVDVEAGIQPKMPALKPWFRAGYYSGSGDNNPGDSRHNTFFQVLPTPRPFARFPFFNMMNNQDRFGILILRPHPKITWSSEFHALRLASAQDLWYSGGGVFQPWTFGYSGRAVNGARSLANLYDGNLEYRVHPRLALTGYLGYAQGRAVTAAIYPQGKNGAFGYLELLYRFF